MGRYRAADGVFRKRACITIHNSTGSATDVTVTIPEDLDEFWAHVRSDGFDVIVCLPDGTTLATFQRATWVYASRSGVLEIDAFPGTSGLDVYNAWLYWHNPDQASDLAGSFTAAGAVSGYVATSRPSTHAFVVRPESVGSEQPFAQIQKTEDEQLAVWMRVDLLLERRNWPSAGWRTYEEVGVAQIDVQTAGSSVPAMVDQTLQRFVEVLGPAGVPQTWVRFFIKGGTTGTDYTLILKLRTVVPGGGSALTQYRVLTPHALLAVQNTKE